MNNWEGEGRFERSKHASHNSSRSPNLLNHLWEYSTAQAATYHVTQLVDVRVPYVCRDVLHSCWCLCLFIRSYQRIFRSVASLLVMTPLLIPVCTLLNNAFPLLKGNFCVLLKTWTAALWHFWGRLEGKNAAKARGRGFLIFFHPPFTQL